ncbi:dihydrofolate reductase [Mesorhizobium sp. J18]|uniref:dihydrofolate reductase n=1 Tax=Mesorhizobium sp. J18 TaxID=935263 RepID=UPI00119AD1E0|nr:dihydrofolate reductase [Mesorhizobium sp. J18]TWH01075.1 dihydrofolate reductase [Mesorhizobium sp. J18]
MKIALVVAIAENGVIGSKGGLPWRLSTDLKRFKATTMGKPILMGRKTWESFPTHPLPGRRNIVITRDRNYKAEGAEVVGSLGEALELVCRAAGDSAPADEVSIIGGGEVYREAMPLADRLYVTHVLANVDGDTYFPKIEPGVWKPVRSEEVPAGEKDIYPTRHVVYERRQGK